jgi:hypothetical protein
VEANGLCTGYSLFVGKHYSDCLLETTVCTQAHILGSWKASKSSCGAFKINVTVLVSNGKSVTDRSGRNARFCREVNRFLQAVAVAESALLCRNPGLANSAIQVHFVSLDGCGKIDEYDRIECWGKLGDWVCCEDKCGCN